MPVTTRSLTASVHGFSHESSTANPLCSQIKEWQAKKAVTNLMLAPAHELSQYQEATSAGTWSAQVRGAGPGVGCSRSGGHETLPVQKVSRSGGHAVDQVVMQ